MQILEKLGRAGNKQNRDKKQIEWNLKYGEGKWKVMYYYNDEYMTREEALDKYYNKSYYEYLKNNPDILQELCTMAKTIYNPHARNTGGVDLQCPAVNLALQKLNKTLNGTQEVAIGVWGTKKGLKYPSISYKLSPYQVKLWNDKNTSVEDFWQNNKYLVKL